jgi:chemotaxis-related protein WspD
MAEEQTPAPDGEPGEAAIAFALGGAWLALPLKAVLEVLGPRTVRSVPHARDRTLVGVVNLRGELRPCVSLAVLLGGSAGTGGESAARRLLAIGAPGAEWIVPVDRTVGLPTVTADALRPPPETGAPAPPEYLRGVFDHDGREVGLLDADRVVAAFERRFA